MDGVEKSAPWRDNDRPGLAAGTGFSALASATFWHEVTATRQTMLDRLASVSHVAVLPDHDRRRVLDDVERTLPDNDTMSVRYRVDVYAARLDD